LHIGQRFPLFADGIGWRAAEVAFPAAGQEGNREAGEEILLATTRSTLLVVLPLCIVMAVIAPSLLQVWLGFADPATVSVLQITAAAVLVDALGVGAIHVLWGKGRARVVLAIVGSVAVGTWILTYMLVPRWGVAGAALGLGLALLAGTIAALELAARACRASALSVVFHAMKGAATPAVLCAAIAYVSVQSFTYYNWTFILLVSGAAGAAYLVSLSAFGLHPEERAMVKHAARFWGRTDRRSPQPLFRLRQRLKRVGPLHSLWHLLLDLRETIIDTPTRARIEFDELHRQRSDPWSYLTIPARGEERFRRADEMLDIIGGPCRRALEVGCSEGLYTRRLAARCDSVLAVDISATALVRAREFCRNLAHVEFREWDLRREELEGDFDLIVAMGVLESFGWPRHLAVARRKLIEMLRPGGWLLVETTRVNPEMEHLWWRRALNRERWLNEFVGEDPRLVTVSSVIDPAAARTLFQKKEA
jgi:trans-aconitate methyltransferase